MDVIDGTTLKFVSIFFIFPFDHEFLRLSRDGQFIAPDFQSILTACEARDWKLARLEGSICLLRGRALAASARLFM